VIELEQAEWNRLFKEVLVVALRMTHTKDEHLKATRRDQAREATQRAFDRLWRSKPARLDTVEAVRGYLEGALRSELSNEKRDQTVRQGYEAAAAREEVALGRGAGAPAEVVHLEAARAHRERDRAARILTRLREELAASSDKIALGTIDCLAQGHTAPAEQAKILQCSVEDIHAARKRRTRAVRKIVAAVDEDDKENV
jgi:hypothetical protein